MLADQVFEWLSELPEWQRDLARRLTSRIDLDDAEYADALALVRHAFEGAGEPAPAAAPQPVQRDHLTSTSGVPGAKIIALGGLQGVGLVGDQEELTFAEDGLTIVYGQNGVGKSTYVRVLKKLCRTVDRDCEVLGSIFEVGAPEPSARIKTKLDGKMSEKRTQLGAATVEPIPGVSVFDSACAELYVDAQNEIQYIPTELRLLARLATLQDRMRRDLDSERTLLRRRQPSLADYPDETAVGRALRRLRGSPEDPDLDQLADLDEKDLARLAELRVVVATAQTSTAREDAAAAEREAREAERLASSIESLAALLHEDSARALKNAVAADRDAREAVALAAQQLEGSIPQVGGGPWQLMWNAARGFVEAGGGTFPPVEGGTCPLCLQAVSAEVAERFVHFQRHVTGEVQAVADLRARELQGRLEAISPLSADSVAAQPLIAALREREPALAENFDSVVAEIRQNLSAWQIAPDDAKPAALDTSVVTKALRAWGEMRSEHARTLREADNSETLPSLRRELAELEARTRLKENLPVFNDWQMILGRIGNLDLAHSALATNRLTSAQRGLIEEGLAKALDAALTDELKKLSCTLPIQMRAEIAKAEASVGLRLLADDPPRVSAIASEGERRALALSFFLAELLVADDSGGVILDDPVSSLDDERRTYIADRLVDESKRRQVIVFTHDLPFVFELRSRAKTAGVGVHVQHVWRQGDDVGRVDEDPPFQTMNLKTRVNRLADDLERMRKDRPPTNDEAWRRVNGFYERLRISWERAVEERLFGGVIERFERNVKTQQFRKIKVTPERLDAIEAGMSQCSRFVHESAYAAPVALPSIDEIAKDLEQLRAFERDTRADD